MLATYFAQILNCTPENKDPNCLTAIPMVSANHTALTTVLSLVFGIVAAVAVLMIVIQGVKFSTSQGDPQKAADARKSIIYAIVGLAVALSAEAVVNLVIAKL